jgi:hypothetical protein
MYVGVESPWTSSSSPPAVYVASISHGEAEEEASIIINALLRVLRPANCVTTDTIGEVKHMWKGAEIRI